MGHLLGPQGSGLQILREKRRAGWVAGGCWDYENLELWIGSFLHIPDRTGKNLHQIEMEHDKKTAILGCTPLEDTGGRNPLPDRCRSHVGIAVAIVSGSCARLG